MQGANFKILISDFKSAQKMHQNHYTSRCGNFVQNVTQESSSMGPKCKTDYFLMRVLKGCYMVVTHNDVETPLNFNISKTVLAHPQVQGGCQNGNFGKSTGPPAKKFLIPSLTTEQCFLFGRNIFFGCLPALLSFLSDFTT